MVRFKRVMKRGWQIVVLAGLSLAALACCVWNIAAMRDELGESTRLYCDSITSQMARSIQDGVNNKKTELVNAADTIYYVYEQGQEDKLEHFLEQKADILGFDALFLLDDQGNAVAQAEEEGVALSVREIAAVPGVRDSFQGRVNMGFFDDQTLFYSAPVSTERDGSLVLVGIRSKENVQSLIVSKSFDSKVASCIVDGQGRLILSPPDPTPFLYLDTVFQGEFGEEAAEALRQVEEGLSMGTDGVASFEGEGGVRSMLAYSSLNINDWTLLTLIPENLFSELFSRYTLRYVLIIGGVTLVFLAYLLTIYHIYAANRENLSRLAFVDPITGGMNDMAFQLQYRKQAQKPSFFPCAVALLNVENFKRVNEKYGFSAGNRILSYIHQEIINGLDGNRGEFAARSEMDHFFLCMRADSQRQVQERLDGIIAAINAPTAGDARRSRLSFTLGCCMAEKPGLEIQVLQDRARIAMRSRRAESVGKCVFYDERIAAQEEKERELEEMFEASLVRGDFEVYLQPKVDLAAGKPNGAEALVRWNHPTRGLISPLEFIPLLERTGKICRLDFYVFQEVCRFYERRKAEGKRWYPISVNLSRYHFYEDEPLKEFYRLYRETGISAGALEFELTESMFFDGEHRARLKAELHRMRELGILRSMDDFGFGYSSLGFLREYDMDTVKLDRSFFLDMESEKERRIIRSVVELAVGLGVCTVAEGIEDEEQLEFLRTIRCDTVQGYYYSKPLRMDEFEAWAEKYETER